MTAGLDLAIATSDPREYEQTKQLGVLISSAVAAAKGATVEDQQGVEWATAVLGEHRALVEDLRVRFVKPLNDHVKVINAFFRQLDGPLAEADQGLRRGVLDYHARVEEKRRSLEAERTRLVAEAAAKEAAALRALQQGSPETTGALGAANAAHDRVDAAPGAPEPLRTVKTVMGSSTVRRVWTFEVLDLSAVPREFLLINKKVVDEAIAAGVREVAGLHIFQRDDLVVRS